MLRRSLRRDGGRGLLHFIGRDAPCPLNPWIRRRIFPGAYTPTLAEVTTHVLAPAGMSVIDVENLRLHYARTCRQWAERLQARAEEARAIVGERIYRTWLLYLTCSSVAFAGGSIGLYQVLMRKQWDQSFTRPTTREDLYA